MSNSVDPDETAHLQKPILSPMAVKELMQYILSDKSLASISINILCIST